MARKRAAWIIRWDWFSENRKPDRLLFYILQPRWKISRVIEHMKFIYLNSDLFIPSERLAFLSSRAWRGLIHNEGPRIIIGDNPIFVGSWVHDLRFETSATHQLVRWTQPAGLRVGRENSRETLGNPTEITLKISIRGHVSQVADPA